MNNKTPIISVRNLTKTYQIGAQKERYKRLSESITETIFHPKKWIRTRSFSQETFYALNNVSFDVYQGDVIGIIGKNGAGKSTLLKILSGITYPTEGEIIMNGRVGSLLEVGTGFHPELTGRENIYFNGSVLGMTRREIEEKFDDIVKFAGIEDFLDTPVKRYSSGMSVRLGFAVAAHLDPEILIIDEVLAVGDAEFQKKCLGKMKMVSEGGRTVLFVSHNMAAVTQLCNHALLIENGIIKEYGDVGETINKYLNEKQDDQIYINLRGYKNRKGSQKIKFTSVVIQNNSHEKCVKYSIGEDLNIIFELESSPEYVNKFIKLAVQLKNSNGIQLCNMIDVDSGFGITDLKSKEEISLCLEDIRFYPGKYYISLWVGSVTSIDIYDYIEDCVSFEIIDGGKLTMRTLPQSAGIIFLTPKWKRK